MSYHAAKRPFSVVKGVLSPDCNVTTVNNTCHPWHPFDTKVIIIFDTKVIMIFGINYYLFTRQIVVQS